MLLFFLLGKYFDKIADEKFSSLWNRLVLQHLLRNILFLILYYFLGVYLISSLLLIGTSSIFIGFIVYGFVLLAWGIVFGQQAMKFFSKYNTRFLTSTANRNPFNHSEDSFDKSNVVFEVKKDQNEKR
jgi:hypothetical protein